MSEKFSLLKMENIKEIEKQKILDCNRFLNGYNLKLTKEDVKEIIEKRNDSLRQTGRIELGEWIVDKMIRQFCDSQYIVQENLKYTIDELINIFYYYKSETNDLISDDELLKIMRRCYDDIAQGDLEYLSGTILEQVRKNIIRK